MMSKKSNTEVLQQDRRIISRRVLAGEISDKDMQSYLKKLPDITENAEEITIDEEET